MRPAAIRPSARDSGSSRPATTVSYRPPAGASLPQGPFEPPAQHLRVRADQNLGYPAPHRRGPAGQSEIHPR